VYHTLNSNSNEILNVMNWCTHILPWPLYAINTSHRKYGIFLYKYTRTLHWVLLPTEIAQLNASFRQYTPQARSPFWLLKQLLNMRMRFCYLDCHDAGLCCYLVIHTESILHIFHLCFFHLWPIYWLPRTTRLSDNGTTQNWSAGAPLGLLLFPVWLG
jgi:hypothetical protein